MRKLFLTLKIFTAITMTAYGQNALTYTEVVKVDSISKHELYNRAKIWFATEYNNASNVLQIDDRDAGQIIGKAVIIYNPTVYSRSEQTKGAIKYTIKIFVKAGRFKYEITDFIHDPYGNHYGKYSVGLITTSDECPNPKPMAKNWSNKIWQDCKDQIEYNMTNLITSLKKEMTTPLESGADDW